MSSTNILPFDGVVNYFPHFIGNKDAQQFYQSFNAGIQWKADEVMMYGKRIVTKRKMAWYATQDISYEYSHITRQSLPFTKELHQLKALIENISGETFNACLLNLYHSGEEGMGWHSDDEPSIVPNSAIASVSLGANRRFSLQHKKTKQVVDIVLENGSLLMMKGETQTCWQHALSKTKKVNGSRINLTYRKMIIT
jgi:alkylated DNA repair dioxygenase AlkB